MTSLLKKEDVLPLIRTLQIGRFDPVSLWSGPKEARLRAHHLLSSRSFQLKDEFHAPFATFLSRLRSLTTFIYSSDGPIPPSLVQTISNSKRHPFLANVHLLSSALVSIEEFARIRRFSGRPPFSSLKRLTLTEEPCEAFFLPEDSIEEGDTDPGWLKNHPVDFFDSLSQSVYTRLADIFSLASVNLQKRRWPFVERERPGDKDVGFRQRLISLFSVLFSMSQTAFSTKSLNCYLAQTLLSNTWNW